MVFKDLSGENSYVNGSEIGLNFAYEISDPRLEAGNGRNLKTIVLVQVYDH